MAEVWTVDNRTYHSDTTKVGSTMLKCILDSPAEFYARYVAKKPDGSPLLVTEPTPDMVLGSATHCLVLEPQKFDSLYCHRPPGIDGRTKDGKQKLAEFRLSALGKEDLTDEQWDKSHRMAEAVLASPLVKELMAGAIFERPIVWEEFGILQKCKPDIYLPRPECDSDLHCDLKTSDEPGPENWQRGGIWGPMRKWGYDVQCAAHYPAGISALTGRPCSAGLIVVGKSEPHQVFVYDATPWWEIGQWHRIKALHTLAVCRESGIWRWGVEKLVDGETESWRVRQDEVISLVPGRWDYPQEAA
jgi:hypothetical protein